jgi:NAD(P)-dependent dehydrogenase (short-subunit alcohol dehydrogenase family)
MDDLAGKVAVITGGAGALGLGLARVFVAERMRVVLADIDEPALDRAVQSLDAPGVEVLGVVTDVADPEAVNRLAGATFDRFGTAHVLCNNAMAGGGGPLGEPPIDVARWRVVMDVSLYPVLYGLDAFLPRMLEQGSGHIVNTASRQGLVPSWIFGAYPAAKAAMISLSEMLHQELVERESPVGVTVLTPGGIRTPGLVAAAEDAKRTGSAHYDDLASRVAMAVEPDDLARLVVRAIKANVFYVNSHRQTLEWLQERVDRMVADADALGTLC